MTSRQDSTTLERRIWESDSALCGDWKWPYGVDGHPLQALHDKMIRKASGNRRDQYELMLSLRWLIEWTRSKNNHNVPGWARKMISWSEHLFWGQDYVGDLMKSTSTRGGLSVVFAHLWEEYPDECRSRSFWEKVRTANKTPVRIVSTKH